MTQHIIIYKSLYWAHLKSMTHPLDEEFLVYKSMGAHDIIDITDPEYPHSEFIKIENKNI
jgi:hypothetical protein